MNESLLQLGIALFAVLHGAYWLRRGRGLFAWPSFAVAGVVSGLAVGRPAIVQWSLWLALAAVAGQILYDGLKRPR